MRALAAAAPAAGIFCDFDGSLSPIVPDPADARAARGAASVLGRLARRFAVVAVVSGRPVLDLARRLRAPGVRLVGIHGMEELVDGAVRVSPDAAGAAGAVEAAAGILEESVRGLRGVFVERKGLALAVHFRRAADPDEAERLAAGAVVSVAAAHGLGISPGRRVLELRPGGSGDKGAAVARIVAERSLRAGLVAGDDVGDLPAFAALDGLEPAVRIAVESAEAPPDLLARADLTVKSPAALVRILRALAGLA
jgi:trehalose 6-phosphate phosphatase